MAGECRIQPSRRILGVPYLLSLNFIPSTLPYFHLPNNERNPTSKVVPSWCPLSLLFIPSALPSLRLRQYDSFLQHPLMNHNFIYLKLLLCNTSPDICPTLPTGVPPALDWVGSRRLGVRWNPVLRVYVSCQPISSSYLNPKIDTLLLDNDVPF